MTKVIPDRAGKSMKVAVSLPAETYARAEKARKRAGASRSALYAEALDNYLRVMEVRELERRYEAGWRKKPLNRKELREIDALMRAGAEVLKDYPW